MRNKQILKISSKSNPGAIAGAIAGLLEEETIVELQAIGAGAVNVSVKAIAIARTYVAPGGINLSCIPVFVDIDIDGENRTGIKFVLVTK